MSVFDGRQPVIIPIIMCSVLLLAALSMMVIIAVSLSNNNDSNINWKVNEHGIKYFLTEIEGRTFIKVKDGDISGPIDFEE